MRLVHVGLARLAATATGLPQYPLASFSSFCDNNPPFSISSHLISIDGSANRAAEAAGRS